jgi:hypothetical protein
VHLACMTKADYQGREKAKCLAVARCHREVPHRRGLNFA